MTAAPHYPSVCLRYRIGARTSLLCLALSAGTLANAQPAARFSGAGKLTTVTTTTSADQRFGLSAELQAAPTPDKASSDRRFALNAALVANKALATACGPQIDQMFKNGFE